MNVNSTQVPHSPTESSSENNENQSNISQLLFTETIITSQTQLISFNMTNMIPSQRPIITNTSEHNNRSSRRQAQRRRRQRQRQRRREEREALQQQQIQRQRQQRQQQRQQQHQQLLRQQQQQRQQRQQQQRHQQQQVRPQPRHYPGQSSQRPLEQYTRWADHLSQWGLELTQRLQQRHLPWELQQNRRQNYYDNQLYPSDHMEEPMDEMYNEQLLEAYMWETMDSKERCEQEQIQELEKIHVVDPFEQITIMQDELEQLQHIDHIQRLTEQEEQIQLEQWEQDQSIVIKDPTILTYISQLEDEIEQLRPINRL
ncbi:unnamed protein product [Adineta steineri]|uniref:Uncharacterized protein n=1 Tax=Adineta steineri TaxID=433720 RepID=A0A816F2X0_9BILA|nr:unnamed protein product [Adineta steineri]CAF1657081.1 unnamed protein product [Adineta steineri]